MYARIVPLVKFTNTVKMEPRLTPDKPAIAVASVESMVVSEPVECSGRSKNAISCLMIARKD